jgi:ribulose-phosphate 3-epimerase
MHANVGRLEDEFKALEAAGVDELHFDISDGQFAQGFTFGCEIIRTARRCCGLPCSAHLMIAQPERHVEAFVAAGCQNVTIHVEACIHSNRLLNLIRAAGAAPGIAINPATPLVKLEYLLPLVDRVLVLGGDPGDGKNPLLASTFERVRILKENIKYQKYPAKIEVEGQVDVKAAAKLAHFGADIFVLGAGSLFDGPGADYLKALGDFKAGISVERHLV